MSSTHRAFAYSFLDRYAALLMAIVSSMIIARLLTPEEIGVFSVTMVLLSFTSALRDLGAGQYLLQEKELTTDRIRAIWAVLLGTGLFFCVLVAAAAYPVARFYGDPRMVDIMLLVSLTFAISPFGSLTYAWLMRELEFESLALMRFVSALVGACSSVYFAWRGWGPISLAIGNVLATLTNAVMAMRVRPAHFPWLPGTQELRRVLSFGGKFSAVSILNSSVAAAPELFLGKLQSLTTAGYFSRASGLAIMFQRLVLDATNSVVLPMFAKESRETGNIDSSLMRSMSYVTVVGWSFFIGLALLAQPAIRLLYGSQWDAAVELTRLLAIGSAIALSASMCPLALTATGAVNRLTWVTGITAGVQIGFIGLASFHSLQAVGIAFIAGQFIGACIWLFVTWRHLGFSGRELLKTWSRSAGVAAVTSLAPLLAIVLFGFNPVSGARSILISVVGGIILFVLSASLLGHPIFAEIKSITNRYLRGKHPDSRGGRE